MKLKTSYLVIIFFGILSFFYGKGYSQNISYFKNDSVKTALLIIDVQYFYFPDGRLPLVGSIEASLKIKKILERFRMENMPVIHVKHMTRSEGEIHENVKPVSNEKVIEKKYANCFRETELLELLKTNNIQRLVICGMQTHMCVEAGTRAAADYGFECIVVQDACATRDLKFEDRIIQAADVHYSTLSSLSGSYAKITNTEILLKDH